MYSLEHQKSHNWLLLQPLQLENVEFLRHNNVMSYLNNNSHILEACNQVKINPDRVIKCSSL